MWRRHISIYHQNLPCFRGILGQNRGSKWVKYAPKITFISWFIGRWALFYPFWPPVLPPQAPKQSKFEWYFKSCHLCIFPTSYVTYSLKITFIPCFIGRWARFTHFDPRFYPNMPPKQGRFGWYFKSCHIHISPTSHVTYSLKTTSIPFFIGRWARFYPFWPPVLPQYAPKTG